MSRTAPLEGEELRSASSGIVTLIRGALLYGIIPIIVGLLIGPGSVSMASTEPLSC
ncbi:MAG TPA: GPGG-motif small membrane protein [Acidimicrobiales bacterium]|nr:GPGG-motif small membrane protein [Acidimicrobiales bacterium]